MGIGGFNVSPVLLNVLIRNGSFGWGRMTLRQATLVNETVVWFHFIPARMKWIIPSRIHAPEVALISKRWGMSIFTT
jgi:hypothetical protein